MKFCQNCGTLNDTELSICKNCGTEIDTESFKKILPFAKNAAYYGFMYRLEYEDQVKENGEVTIKYSLLEPSNYYDFIAVAALTGYIGGVAHQIVNYVGKQIVDFIKQKIKPDEKDKEFIEFFEDADKVEKFAKYVNEYYTGKHLKNRKVADAIFEEEMADYATDEKGEEFAKSLRDFNPEEKGELLEIFTEIAKGVTRQRRELIPSKNELKELFGAKKKELVKEKKGHKTKKKNRKKKRKK